MRRAPAALVALATAGALAAGAALPAAASAAAPSPARARLQGQFQMAGKVIKASGVHGVHVGDRVLRSWTFTPGCAAGACQTVTLVRSRGHGSDTVTLQRAGQGRYLGSGSFYAPLRCGGRVYPHGELVPFTIKVRITAAATSSGVIVATRVNATFINPSRKNQTACVVVPGHDAAKYHGHLI